MRYTTSLGMILAGILALHAASGGAKNQRSQYIFGISASGRGWVGGYGSKAPDDGSASGAFFIAPAAEPARTKSFPQISGTEGSDASVWLPGGTAALVESSTGLYHVPTNGDLPKQILKSPMLAGLAIDESGGEIAFWTLQRDRACLAVRELESTTPIRNWCMPTRYGGDLTRFEIAFSGSYLLARTYDQQDATPLKRFDLATGKATIIVPNVHAVGFTKSDVFFVPEGPSETGLYHLTAADGETSLIARLRCDAIAASPDAHHVLCQSFGDAPKSILISGPALSSRRTVPCKSSAALDDQYLFCAAGGTITRLRLEPGAPTAGGGEGAPE